jgi:hypothetical protein
MVTLKSRLTLSALDTSSTQKALTRMNAALCFFPAWHHKAADSEFVPFPYRLPVGSLLKSKIANGFKSQPIGNKIDIALPLNSYLMVNMEGVMLKDGSISTEP